MTETTDAAAIFAPIWRRKWLILLVALLAAAGSYLYYKRQPKLFQSTTQLFLNAGNESQFTEKGLSQKSSSLSATTQPQVINAFVVEDVRKQLRKEHNKVAKMAARGTVRAKSGEKSAVITITAESHGAKASALLANTVAQTYIRRQHTTYVRSVEKAISIAHRQLRRIEAPRPASGGKSAGTSATSEIQAASLNSKINQLESLLTVEAVEQARPAKPKNALLLSPKPRKNAEFGFVIGLVLASIAAFVLSRFNRRLRSRADIESALQAEVIATLPTVRRPIVHEGGLPRPSKLLLEPLRRLHTTIMLAAGGQATANGQGAATNGQGTGQPRTILFLSPEAGDGKSTIVADLALVMREAGEGVAVVEADFRRPVQARLLGLDGSAGLSGVLTGAASLEQAMQTVPGGDAEEPSDAGAGAGATVTLAPHKLGELSVLVSGPEAANPPALLASAGMTATVRSIAQGYDRVLIDVPPPLEVSDAIPLLGEVDAVVIVARPGHTREATAQHLRQLLARTPGARVLGVVANGVAAKEVGKYGLSGGRGRRGWLARLIGR